MDIERPNHGPGPAEGAMEGNPIEAIHEYYASDGRSLGVWECTPGRLLEEEHSEDEFCTILAGKVGIIDNEEGTERSLLQATASSSPKEAVSPGSSTRRFSSST